MDDFIDDGYIGEQEPEHRPQGPHDTTTHVNYKGTIQHRTIKALKKVPLERSVQLRHNRLTTSRGKELIFPAKGGKVLTEETAVSHRTLNQLVDYLQNWAEAENLAMDDVREFIDDESGTERAIIKCVLKQRDGDFINFEYDIEYLPSEFRFGGLYDNTGEPVHTDRTYGGFAFSIPYWERERFVDCKVRFISPINNQILQNQQSGLARAAPTKKAAIPVPDGSFFDDYLINQSVQLTLPIPDMICEGDRFAVGAKMKWMFHFTLMDHYVQEGVFNQFEGFDSPKLTRYIRPKELYRGHIVLEFEIFSDIDHYDLANFTVPMLILHPLAKEIVERVIIRMYRYMEGDLAPVHEDKGATKVAEEPVDDEHDQLPEVMIDPIYDVCWEMGIPEEEIFRAIIPTKRLDDTHFAIHFPFPVEFMSRIPSIGRLVFGEGVTQLVGSIPLPTNPTPSMLHHHHQII